MEGQGWYKKLVYNGPDGSAFIKVTLSFCPQFTDFRTTYSKEIQ